MLTTFEVILGKYQCFLLYSIFFIKPLFCFQGTQYQLALFLFHYSILEWLTLPQCGLQRRQPGLPWLCGCFRPLRSPRSPLRGPRSSSDTSQTNVSKLSRTGGNLGVLTMGCTEDSRTDLDAQTWLQEQLEHKAHAAQ